MATRMQQRRGTAATWTAADPILAAGEIGFEIDTNKFKIGDGSNRWANLTYFTADAAAAIQDLIDGAPGVLDTLNELAAAVNDDPNFFATVATNLSNHEADTTNVHGIANTSELATKAFAASLLTGATKSNITITGDKNGLTITAENGVADSDTDDLAEGTTNKYFTDERAQDAVGNAVGTGLTYTDATGEIKVTPNTYDAYGSAATAASNAATALTNHENDTTNIHGITDTSALATKTYADSAASNAVSNHEADTTSVHGISDTSKLVTTDGAQTLTNKTITSPSGIVKSDVGLGNVDNTSDANKPVSTATQSALDLKANLSGSSFTGNVQSTGQLISTNSTNASSTSTGAIVATGGLGVGGSAYIGGDLVITGDFTVNGTTTTVSTQDLLVQDPLIYVGEDNNSNSVDLGLVASFDDGVYQHTGLARDASDGKWKLFRGVIDEPTTTINFSQGYLDDIAVGGLSANTLTVGDVSNTEIGYLNGVSSNIQTQLDAMVEKAGDTMTGALTLSGAPTQNLHAATKLYVDTEISTASSAAETYTDNQINALNTDDLAEGTTNKYYLDSRARSAVSGGTGLDYNSSTGVFDIDSTVATLTGTQTLTNKTISSASNTITVQVSNISDITASSSELNILDGVTASTAELNILDGITASTTELNYVDGVTSAIQTQLNAKAALASPALTGIPTAPTATAGTNTTQIATTAFVDAAIQALASRSLVLDGGGV